jgi:hypothetical protein
MKAVDAEGLVGYAVAAGAGAVAAAPVVAVAASVLAKSKRGYLATGWCSAKSTVAALDVGLAVLEVRIELDMDRPWDCSL